MPLSAKDRKLKRHFTDEYEDGERVYYATLNKRINEGRPIHVPESKRLAAKRKHHRTKRKEHRRHERRRRL